MRRLEIAAAAVILIAWAATGYAATVFDEGFDDFQTGVRPVGWTFINCNADTDSYTFAGYYGALAPSVKLDATGDQIVSEPFSANSGQTVQFWLRGTYGSTTSSLLIEEFYSLAWFELATISSLPQAGTTEGPYALNAGSIQVRFSYNKSAGNVGIDDVRLDNSAGAPTSLVDSGDYNGDGTSDIAIFRGAAGMWSIRNFTRAYFGNSTDSLVPADYNGDGTADIAIFRESGGMWSVRNLSRFYLGAAGDQPVPGDYNGDGIAEAGIFRESAGRWSIRNLTRVYLGAMGDTVIPGYYFADNSKAFAIFRGSSGMWSVRNLTRFYFGASTDDLVPGDYNGAGFWEAGIFRPSSSMWSIRNVTRMYLGSTGDWALPADYDGNGVDEAGIFRDTAGMWSVRNITRVYFGGTGDIPVTR